VFHVIAAMAEFERELIRERVNAGLAEARRKGIKLGRPRLLRDHDKQAKTIRRMRSDGRSYRQIATALGRSVSDVYRIATA
jgi:DNA invertase Pin-like site-specific DNA recombinase